MSDSSTIRMIAAHVQRSPAPMFLSSFFRTPPENIHDAEKVEIDVDRDDEDIAVPVPDLSTGPRHNEASKYVNKSFTPPILSESAAITAWEAIKRQAGQNPFEDPSFARNAGTRAFNLMDRLRDKCRRTVELMAAQVFSLGVITLVDSGGVTVFSEDFKPKTAHMITVSTTWATDGSTGSPLADIAAAARLIRKDGKRSPDRIVFGASAMQRFLANAAVQKQLDKSILNLGNLDPAKRNEDATFYGMIWIDSYQYELWLYDAFFKHPQTGTLTPYVGDEDLLIMSSKARLDLTFGSIPMIVPPDARALAFLPPRIQNGPKQIDLTINAWVTPNGQSVQLSVGTRPLPIPTEIDSFARINVTV